MPDKYKHFKGKARKRRAKEKMCLNKKSFDTKEEAYQKGQRSYKCPHCKKWHRSGSLGRLVIAIRRKKDIL